LNKRAKTIDMEKNISFEISGIKCDNTDCDYVDETVKFDNYEQWLNKPCPKCGENLLTESDYELTKKVMSVTKTINEIPESEMRKRFGKGEVKTYDVNIHNGISYKEV